MNTNYFAMLNVSAESGSFVLDFGGRVLHSSQKNFKLVESDLQSANAGASGLSCGPPSAHIRSAATGVPRRYGSPTRQPIN